VGNPASQGAQVVLEHVAELPISLPASHDQDTNASAVAYQTKLFEIAIANVQFAFEFGLRFATVGSPTEFFGVLTEFTSRQVDMFGQHSKELAASPFLAHQSAPFASHQGSL